MEKSFLEHLREWQAAGLLEPAQAERILAYEERRGLPGSGRRRLFPVLASACGAVLLGAGALLFVAANWQALSPGARFALVLAMVGCGHLGGALAAARASGLATALHGLGSVALGAGIFLAGQIFNLQEHWPGGVLLWALGAWLGYALLRDWVQGLLAALLTPAWIGAEWIAATQQGFRATEPERVLALAVLLLAITYLTAQRPDRDSPGRLALAWAGGLALIPSALALIVLQGGRLGGASQGAPLLAPDPLLRAGQAVAMAAPLALAALLRGRAAWMNLAAALWALALSMAAAAGPGWSVHALCALGSMGLVLWGVGEGRSGRVNLGLAGFALTVTAFYFSGVMDKLGRSLGLMGLGGLFLGGGWLLERLRRRLNAFIGRRTP